MQLPRHEPAGALPSMPEAFEAELAELGEEWAERLAALPHIARSGPAGLRGVLRAPASAKVGAGSAAADTAAGASTAGTASSAASAAVAVASPHDRRAVARVSKVDPAGLRAEQRELSVARPPMRSLC